MGNAIRLKKSRINRLRVFSYVKRVMETEGRCPTGEEVAQVTGLSGGAARSHMIALSYAEGLPMPIPPGITRRAEVAATALWGCCELSNQMARKRGADFDPNAISLDKLFN